jgi:hypothetical protein
LVSGSGLPDLSGHNKPKRGKNTKMPLNYAVIKYVFLKTNVMILICCPKIESETPNFPPFFGEK